MNHLPKVLRNEIWEYVRGNRAFWKYQYKKTMCFSRIFDRLDPTPSQVLMSTKQLSMTSQYALTFSITNYRTWLDFLQYGHRWIVVQERQMHNGWVGLGSVTFSSLSSARLYFYNRCWSIVLSQGIIPLSS